MPASYGEQLRDFVTKCDLATIIAVQKLISEQRHAESLWFEDRKRLQAAQVTDDKLQQFDEKVWAKAQEQAARHQARLAQMGIDAFQGTDMELQRKFLDFLSDLCT